MRVPPVPGLKYGKGQKLGTPARPEKAAAGPIIEIPEPSWGHGVDTQQRVTEGELKGDRY